MEKKIIGFKIIKKYPFSQIEGYMINNFSDPICREYLNFPEFFQPIYEEEKVIDLDKILMDNAPFTCSIGPVETKMLMKATAEETIDFVVDFLKEDLISVCRNLSIVKEKLKEKIK